MKATRMVFTILAVIITVSSVAALNPSTAHASGLRTSQSHGNPARNCGGVELHLMGKDKFTANCLPKKTKAQNGTISPLTTNECSNCSKCNASDIAMYVNINYDNAVGFPFFDSYYSLCIQGAGSISNFQNIIICEVNYGFCSNNCFWYNCNSYHTSWNDIASSFTTGAWYGRMYKDANLSGDWAQFSPNESCADMRNMAYSFTSGPLNFNDVISSISVGGTYSEGPIVC